MSNTIGVDDHKTLMHNIPSLMFRRAVQLVPFTIDPLRHMYRYRFSSDEWAALQKLIALGGLFRMDTTFTFDSHFPGSTAATTVKGCVPYTDEQVRMEFYGMRYPGREKVIHGPWAARSGEPNALENLPPPIQQRLHNWFRRFSHYYCQGVLTFALLRALCPQDPGVVTFRDGTKHYFGKHNVARTFGQMHAIMPEFLTVLGQKRRRNFANSSMRSSFRKEAKTKVEKIKQVFPIVEISAWVNEAILLNQTYSADKGYLYPNVRIACMFSEDIASVLDLCGANSGLAYLPH